MSSYLEQTLAPDEEIRYHGNLSLWPFFWHVVVGVILIAALGLGLIVLGALWIKIRSTELDVTNKRILIKTGFISRRTLEMNLNRIESIQVIQSPWGRMFNYGTVIVDGTGATHEPVVSIRDPLAFRREALAAQEDMQQRVGHA